MGAPGVATGAQWRPRGCGRARPARESCGRLDGGDLGGLCRWLEAQHPAARAVNLQPSHLFGVGLRELSAAQLDVLGDVLLARLKAVEEMKLFRNTCGFPEHERSTS